MRSLCIVLLVASIFTASHASVNAKINHKRLIDDFLGGLVADVTGGLLNLNDLTGGLLTTVNNVLDSVTDAVKGLLGGSGVVGGLVKQILNVDESILSDLGLDGLVQAVDGLVNTALAVVTKAVNELLALLGGVDLSNTDALIKQFESIACNKLCVACSGIPNANAKTQCVNYCKTKCRWAFA